MVYELLVDEPFLRQGSTLLKTARRARFVGIIFRNQAASDLLNMALTDEHPLPFGIELIFTNCVILLPHFFIFDGFARFPQY